MKFNYQARTKEGSAQSGAVEAPTKEVAISLLQKYNLYVTLLEEVRGVPFYARRIKFFERVSRKEVVTFSRQLAIMFKAKVSLAEALRVLASQIKKEFFKEKLLKIAEEVEGGNAFSRALSGHPEVFSPFYISMVKTGEAAGTLSQSLNYLADHLEREYLLYSRIRGAMIYPAFIVLVIIGVLTMMVLFVIPQMAKVLQETEQELPLVTKIVIGSSDFLRSWGWLLASLIIGGGILVARYLRTKQGKQFWDGFILKIPFAGDFLKLVYLSRFAENLSTLISGGLPIARALEITSETAGNDVYRRAILIIRDEVRRGEPINAILARFPDIFPPVFTQMALVGERTGTLDSTLMNAAEFYDKEVDQGVDNLLGLLEPALIVFLALVVGGIVAAVLLPLYKVAAV